MLISGDSSGDFKNCSNITVYSSGDNSINFYTYRELLKLYSQSKYIVIPIVKFAQEDTPVLSGLTSYIDAISLGIPFLMSDNTLIGEDNLGFIYKAGDVNDFLSKLDSLINLTDVQYKDMKEKLLNYSNIHCYDRFCKDLNHVMINL
jgi:hypothetical protein